MITQTLNKLVSAVERLSDVKLGTGSGSRHTRTKVIGYINDANRRYQTLLVNRGFMLFVTETSAAALPSTAETDENYSTVSFPTDAASIQRVDVRVGGQWISADYVEWSQLRDFNYQKSSRFQKIGFAVKSIPTVSGTTVSAGTIAIAPFIQGTYKISYLAEVTEVTEDEDLFRFMNQAGADWVTYEVVAKITLEDRDSKTNYAMASAERDRALNDIGRAVPVVVNTGSKTTIRSRNYR